MSVDRGDDNASDEVAVATRRLLSGGNPQIAKADGDAPVQAYRKRDVGAWLDALVVRTVPDVQKAVRWNSPFYGVEDQGWFLSFHCFTKCPDDELVASWIEQAAALPGWIP